jgi:hypothetical protein
MSPVNSSTRDWQVERIIYHIAGRPPPTSTLARELAHPLSWRRNVQIASEAFRDHPDRIRNVGMTSSAGRLGVPLSIGDMCKRAFFGKPTISEKLEFEKLSNAVARRQASPGK